MATEPNDYEQPYRVVTTTAGEFVKGYATLAAATESATERNDRAQVLDIATRYKATATPQPEPVTD
jgi:hypothetical protein